MYHPLVSRCGHFMDIAAVKLEDKANKENHRLTTLTGRACVLCSSSLYVDILPARILTLRYLPWNVSTPTSILGLFCKDYLVSAPGTGTGTL